MSKDNGGPAFPRPASQDPEFGGRSHAQPGMTLRDYFAAKAMQGMFSIMEDGPSLQRAMKISGFTNPHEWLAHMAYRVADAMLAERNK